MYGVKLLYMVYFHSHMWVVTIVPILLLMSITSLHAEEVGQKRFEEYLKEEYPVADGFLSYKEIKTKDGRVLAIANGYVSHLQVNKQGSYELHTTHRVYENHLIKEFVVIYKGVAKPRTQVGRSVKKHQIIATKVINSYKLEVRHDSAKGHLIKKLSRFLRQRQKLFVPSKEPILILVDHDSYNWALVKRGKLQKVVDIAFGQMAGKKEIQGDLKTPKGMYFVVQKYRGKFSGVTGPFYGGHWIKINYPNYYDAQRGLTQGLISKSTAKQISKKWIDRKLTNQKTKLGGGIGFHGWAYEWDAKTDGRHLSWGCIVMHNRDIKKLYEEIPVGTMVVIL